MQTPILFAPTPRNLTFTGGFFEFEDHRFLVLEHEPIFDLSPSAVRLQQALQSKFDWTWEIGGNNTSPEKTAITLQIEQPVDLKDQGYRLSISPSEITITASSPPGIFYGVCTFIQLLEQCGSFLPCLQIEDWPDFPARGVMVDISRDKVPTMETLRSLIDLLASWKINQVQLYTEHTFAYSKHPKIWANASPVTGAEIKELDNYCRERYIQLVPNQNSFGHMRRWLVHPEYSHLAEINDRFEAPWGYEQGPFSLCPVDPESLSFISSLFDEILPFFSSSIVNVGCDETFDLGQGRSREACFQHGTGKVYLDYLMNIYQDVKNRSLTMQFWGDIILRYPELISQLPKDLIALDWGYEANHPFDANGAQFSASGIPFYVCPGTSSWCSLAGRTENTLLNLKNAAENGLKFGAVGYLITDWGDNGHWQSLPVSYLGFLAGAAYAWGLEANQDLDIAAALDQVAFRDRAGVMGKVAFELGNIYQTTGLTPINSSVLFTILQRPLSVLVTRDYLPSIPFKNVLEAIDSAAALLFKANMDRVDQDIILKEFELTVQILRHACHRGMLAVNMATRTNQYSSPLLSLEELNRDLRRFIEAYQRVWLQRNRPGGLSDSVARFDNALKDYQESPVPDMGGFPSG
jgi:hexosaminidase